MADGGLFRYVAILETPPTVTIEEASMLDRVARADQRDARELGRSHPLAIGSGIIACGGRFVFARR